MKKHLIVVGMLFIGTIGFGQNVFNTAAGSFVGIGTPSPLVKLDVRSNTTTTTPSTQNLAYYGMLTQPRTVVDFMAGLYVTQKESSPGLGLINRGTVLQYVNGNPTNSLIHKGFVEFNNPATANTTIAAVSFGSNYQEFMRINQNGRVRIGSGANDIKTPAGYKLFVEDGILTEKVQVAIKTTADWADYVFADKYNLMPLNEVEDFVKDNNHLPNVPSAADMVEKGLDVAKMDAKLLEKIEELTLYIIQQNKRIEALEAKSSNK